MGTTDDSLAGRLAGFVHSVSLADAPAHAPSLLERCFIDTVGVALAGAARQTGAATEMYPTGTGPATAIGYGTTATITDATFLNGMAAHSLEIDDGSPGVFGHPSVTLVPPLLALAEREQLDGQALLTAYLAGFEAMCYLGDHVNPSHYEAGWHSTATLGVFGAAAAVASALDLSAETTANAFRAAASMPAGLRRNFESSAKAMHAGQAGRSGLTAALLGSSDFTGAQGALGSENGFIDVYTRPDEPTLSDLPTLGTDWAIDRYGINRKRYPCCYYTQTALVSALEITAEREVDSTEIRSVTVEASPGAVEVLSYDDPPSGQAAKFSMPHTVAAALLDEDVGFETFTDGAVDRADIAALRERITLVTDECLPYFSYETTVRLETGDETIERTRELPPGAYGNPLSDEAFAEKFRECATEAVPATTATALFEHLSGLHDVKDAGSMLDPLQE